MLLVVAALAVPRTPDAPAALAEPEARDAHELERGWGKACKDRIEPYMYVDDAMDACGEGPKCAFCAIQVKTLGGKYVSRRNNKPLEGNYKLQMHLLGSDKSWMYRCTSHPFKWHGLFNRIPPRCEGADTIPKSSKATSTPNGKGWHVPMYKGKTDWYDFAQLAKESWGQPCLCLKYKMEGLGFDEEALSWEDAFRACKLPSPEGPGFKEKDLTRCAAAPGDKRRRVKEARAARMRILKENLAMFGGIAKSNDDGIANLIAV